MSIKHYQALYLKNLVVPLSMGFNNGLGNAMTLVTKMLALSRLDPIIVRCPKSELRMIRWMAEIHLTPLSLRFTSLPHSFQIGLNVFPSTVSQSLVIRIWI